MNLLPPIMGRLAAWFASAVLGIIGMAGLFGYEVSRSLERLGPEQIDTLWYLALITGGTLATAAVIADKQSDDEAAMVLERGGAILTVTGLGVWVFAIYDATQTLEGNLMAFGLAGALSINLAGRQYLLWRRFRKLSADFNDRGDRGKT